MYSAQKMKGTLEQFFNFDFCDVWWDFESSLQRVEDYSFQ